MALRGLAKVPEKIKYIERPWQWRSKEAAGMERTLSFRTGRDFPEG
jgi:hypothetical protein